MRLPRRGEVRHGGRHCRVHDCQGQPDAGESEFFFSLFFSLSFSLFFSLSFLFSLTVLPVPSHAHEKKSHAGFWGRAEDIDVPSDVGYLVPGKPSADLAGAVSAALSLCAFALASAADASALVAAEDSDGSSSAAAVSAAAARFTRLRDGRSALDVAGTYLSVAADLHAQAEASPGLHTPHVDSMLPDFYNSTSYLDDVALAGAALALTTGGSTSVGFRRSNAAAAAANNASSSADADGVTVLTSGVSAAAAAALRARADEISAARGTPRLRAPEDYWRAGRAARRAWLKTPQAQTNTLSWDNVGPLAGNMMARTALSSPVANISISRSGARGFESPEAMLNFFTAPAQVAVLSWIATAKYAPARILGSLAGFGDKVEYIPQGEKFLFHVFVRECACCCFFSSPFSSPRKQKL